MLAHIAVAALVLSGLSVLYAVVSIPFTGWKTAGRALFQREARPLFFTCLAIVVAGYLLTLPVKGSFSSGQTLGVGFLLGGVMGLLLYWYALALPLARLPGGENGGVVAAAAFVPVLLLYLLHADPNSALMGCALAALALAAVAQGTVHCWPSAPDGCERVLGLYALGTALVVTATRLAMQHFPHQEAQSAITGYWALPALLVAVGALLLTLLLMPRWRLFQRLPWLTGSLAALLVVVLVVILQRKWFPLLLWDVPLYGALAFSAIVAMFSLEEEHSHDKTAYRPLALTIGMVVLLLAVSMLSFRRLHGFGEVLALLPGLLVLAPVYLRNKDSLSAMLTLGGLSILLLFTFPRLLLEGVGQATLLDFQQQYNLFALLLGIGMAVGVIALSANIPVNCFHHLARTLLLLLGMLMVPMLVLVFFGSPALLALLTGLAIGALLWMLMLVYTTGENRTNLRTAAPCLLLIIGALAAIQFTPLIIAFNVTHATKNTAIIVITAIAICWVLIDLLRGMRRNERAV